MMLEIVLCMQYSSPYPGPLNDRSYSPSLAVVGNIAGNISGSVFVNEYRAPRVCYLLFRCSDLR